MKILKEKKYSLLVIISKYSFILVFILALLMPVLVGAGKHPPAKGITLDTGITNPLGSSGPSTIPEFIKAIIDVVLIIGIPILTLAIIYAGFLFVKAQGNAEELKVAKNTLLYTVIGGALLLGAFVIASAIGQTVEDIKTGAMK